MSTIEFILVGIIILMGLGLLIQDHELGVKEQLVSEYIAQVAQLHQDSIRANQDAYLARQRATEAMIDAARQAKQIMSAKVPQDCQKAMAWGLSQAKTL
jgi:hypothetical protein